MRPKVSGPGRAVCRATGVNVGRCACGAPAILLEGEGGMFRVVCPSCGARGRTLPSARQASEDWSRQMGLYERLAATDPGRASAVLVSYEDGDVVPAPCRCGNMLPSMVASVPNPESNVTVRCDGCGRRSLSGPGPVAVLTWNLGEVDRP